MKRWEKRRFFIRRWEPKGDQPIMLHGVSFAHVFEVPAVTIYGYEEDSEVEEDHHHIDLAMKKGLVFGKWFSQFCRDGEWGTQVLNLCEQITEKDFELAKENDWPMLPFKIIFSSLWNCRV